MTRSILLNCDMGESFGAWQMGDDGQVMPLIDQANLACGFHAGDPLTMQRSVALAVQCGVQIGAHPSYPDLQGFGRRHMRCSAEELEALLIYQLGALQAFCQVAGAQLAYVKPHGALYHDLLQDEALLAAALRACARYRQGLPLMLLARTDNSSVQRLADVVGVPLLFEAFADRAYLPDGRLVPRGQPDAVHAGAERTISQGVAIARGQAFADSSGQPLQLQADSLCVHGDNPHALAALRRLRAALDCT